MERVNDSVLSQNENEGEASEFEIEIVTCFLEAGAMHCKDP